MAGAVGWVIVRRAARRPAAGLLLFAERRKGELLFFSGRDFSNFRAFRRSDDCTAAIEKAIETRAQSMVRSSRHGVVSRLENVAQLIPRAGVKEIEGVVFERSVNARPLHQDPAAFRERGMPHILDAMESGELVLEILQQIEPRFD